MEVLLDFDNYPRSSRFYGGRGKKRGIRMDGDNWIVKYAWLLRDPADGTEFYSSGPLSEYLGSQVYALLGLPVHETRLGLCGGKLAVACRDYTDDLPVQAGLLRIYTVQQLVNDTLGGDTEQTGISSPRRTQGTELGNLLHTLAHHPLAGVVLRARFWAMFIVDILLGNGGRSLEDWGFYCTDGPVMHLLPVYANAHCLLPAISDGEAEQILADPDRYEAVLYDGGSHFLYRGREVDRLAVIQQLGLAKEEKSYGLMEALCRIVPAVHWTMSAIQFLLDRIPETCRGVSVLCPARRQLYGKLLADRQEKILEPALRKASAYRE